MRAVRAILLLAVKDVRLQMRDRLGAFFTFAFPVLYALLFGLMFSGSGEGTGTVQVALVDEDRSDGSRAFVERMAGSDALRVTLYDTRTAGTEQVRRGKESALIVLPEGFGDPASTLVRGERVRLEGVVDPSRRAESAILQGTLFGLVFRHIGDTFGDAERARAVMDESREAMGENAPPEVAAAVDLMLSGVEGLLAQGGGGLLAADADGPVSLELSELSSRERTAPVTAFALTFPQGAAWGLMACALGSSLSLVGERSRGTLVRLSLAPIGRWQILAGKALGCLITSVAMMAVLVGFAHLPFFGVRPESYVLLAVASVCACVAFVGVMMLIASFGRTVAAVEGFGRAVLLVMALAGGAAVPVVFMPDWMRSVAGVSPFRWVIEALDGVIWRGFGPQELLLPCGILIGIGLVGFIAGAGMFRFSRMMSA
ncbi:MAG: ABC transporter permease [Planctomycetota bacterium]